MMTYDNGNKDMAQIDGGMVVDRSWRFKSNAPFPPDRESLQTAAKMQKLDKARQKNRDF